MKYMQQGDFVSDWSKTFNILQALSGGFSQVDTQLMDLAITMFFCIMKEFISSDGRMQYNLSVFGITWMKAIIIFSPLEIDGWEQSDGTNWF
jgi:hypothetical protein